MDLKTKLAFALVSASLLSMAAFGWFTYLWAEDMILEDARRQLTVLAESKQREIHGAFERWKQEVADVVDRARSTRPIAGEPDPQDATSLDAIAGVLGDARASSDSLRRLTLFDVEGNSLLGGAGAGTTLGVPDDEVAFAGLQVESDGRLGVVFHARLPLDGRGVAIVEAVFDAHALDRFLGPTAGLGGADTSLLLPARIGPGEPGSAGVGYFLLHPTAQGLAPDRAARSLSEAPTAIAAALLGEEQVFDAVADHRGQEVMAVTRSFPESGWGLLVEVESEEARGRADRLLTNMRDLGVSLTAFAILGGTLLGMHLGRPIHKLVQEVDRIRHGEVGLRLEVKGEDEVAFLAQSLNEFMDQLDRSSDLFRLGALRVLVIDPTTRSRELLRDLLRNWNMQPTESESWDAASSAIEAANRSNRPPQLVLLDESISDGDVTQLADQLRSATPGGLPIILLASKPDTLDAERLKRAGIGVLPKPVVASHLMDAILGEVGVSAEGLAPLTDAFLRKTTPRKILLAEDSVLIQQVMIGFLGNWGHEVTVAENGRRALEILRSESFDLVLMDVQMPEMNGLEVTAATRAHERAHGGRTPIIALTAEAMAGDRERCIEAGMDDYISKPVDPKALYALIERYPARMGASRPPDAGGASRAAASGGPDLEPGLVDWQRARSHAGGDEELLSELVAAFPGEGRRQLEAMRRGIEDGDAELLTRSAHSLKGAALIFGASALVEGAIAMEGLGRRSEWEGTRPLLERLEVETSRLGAALAGGPGRGGARST